MLTSLSPRTFHFRSLSLHGFHRVVVLRMGRARQPQRRRLRARHRSQRPRFRRARRGARADAPRARTRHAGPRRKRVAARSDGLRRADVPHDVDCADQLRAVSRTSRGSARRWARCSASCAPRMPGTPVRRLVVNDAGPVLEPAALARIGQYFGTDPTFATYEELQGLREDDLRAVRPADRCAMGARDANECAPARRWPLGCRLRSRHRRAVSRATRRAGSVAALGCDHAVRRSCCAARNPICCRAPRRAR